MECSTFPSSLQRWDGDLTKCFVHLCITEHEVHISSDLVSLYEQYTGAVFEDINKLTTHSPIQHMEGIKVGVGGIYVV